MPWDHEIEHEYIDTTAPVEMLRLNTGKPRLSLLPTALVMLLKPFKGTALLYETARVMDFGATKYAMNNWRKSGPWLKVLDSGLRHLDKLIFTDETHDPESGISHAGHLACNLGFLLEFIRETDGTDDRYVTKTRLNAPPLVGLDGVYLYLMDWKDGGLTRSLEQAVITLSQWYEKESLK